MNEYCQLLLNIQVCISIPKDTPLVVIGILHRLGRSSKLYSFEDIIDKYDELFPDYKNDEFLEYLKYCEEQGFFSPIYETNIEDKILREEWNAIPMLPKKPKIKPTKHLYIIKDLVTGHYKIGVSKHPKERLKTLNIASCNPLLLFKVYNNKSDMEVLLHEHFKHKQTNSEWFSLSESDLEEIKNIIYGNL